MAKYHVNQATQRPNICKAKPGKCPYGADTPHFNSKEEARVHIEREMNKEYGSTTIITKKVSSTAELSAMAKIEKDSGANLVYHPEDYGLNLVAEDDCAGPYEFDQIKLFKSNNENFYIVEDSGCSCPIPFEYIKIADLKPIKNFSELRKHVGGGRIGFMEKAMKLL